MRTVSDFKLVGLSKNKSMTCEPLNNENTFWPEVGITQERFNALWGYCGGNWNGKKIAEIEHDGLYEDGTPINPIVIAIKEA